MIMTVSGPADSGPGERAQMLQAAHEAFERFEADEITRLDVPPKGTSSDDDTGVMRSQLAGLVPALQSGSLFGGKTGVLVVDAQQFLKAEAEVVAELIAAVDQTQVAVVFVAAGAIPAPLGKALKSSSETVAIKRLRERDASAWLEAAARDRHLRLSPDVIATMVQRFGTDVAAMSQALDQLAASGEAVTPDVIMERFKNRPDEPMWHFADAVADGDVGEALRRLEDFLIHGHPLQLLAFVEGELRRVAVAGAAPDLETYASWVGGKPDSWPVRKVWRRRGRSRPEDLRRAIDAVSRADLALKTVPDATHRVTLERLTVALCRWYGGSSSA